MQSSAATNGAPARTYPGVTEPVSLAGADDKSRALSASLERTLRDYGLFEPDDEARRRERVLGQLNVVVQDWITDVSIKKGMDERLAAEAGAKIFTFGSFRLGVHGRGADIDTLLVVPRHVGRAEFFTELYEILKSDQRTSEIVAVPDAYVPVMKLVYDGIDIDLLFARLALPSIPASLDVLDDQYLKNLDEKSVLSLNGVRVTDSILALVPEIPTFRIALRCMKKWAKARGIYSNVMGYLGGVSWAILTARICQLYPNAPPSVIVSRFFRVYEQWRWPSPVMLTHIRDSNVGAGRVWNPKVNPRERQHLMPVITPAYPAMNSTYNTSRSTLAIMKDEFRRGTEETFKIEHQQAPWTNLFAPTDLFRRFKHYLQIDICAANEDALKEWIGWCESRLRILVLKLERVKEVLRVHPHPVSFDHANSDPSSAARLPLCSSFFFGLAFQPTNGKRLSVDLTPAVKAWTAQVKERVDEPINDVRVTFCKRAKLPIVVAQQDPYCQELRAKLLNKRKRGDAGDENAQTADAAAAGDGAAGDGATANGADADGAPDKRARTEAAAVAAAAAGASDVDGDQGNAIERLRRLVEAKEASRHASQASATDAAVVGESTANTATQDVTDDDLAAIYGD